MTFDDLYCYVIYYTIYCTICVIFQFILLVQQVLFSTFVLALRETPPLPCARSFTVCTLSGTQQTDSLPCAQNVAHDKYTGTRQTGCLPCPKCLAHSKQIDTRHSPIFAVCRSIQHTGNTYTRQKRLLCRVFLLSTRQI